MPLLKTLLILLLFSHLAAQSSIAAQRVEVDSVLDSDKIQKWLNWNRQALICAYGTEPNKEFSVAVNASKAASNSPIPWGQVNRGPLHNRIRFIVDQQASYQDLISDWTAYHEYSHLLIPYQGWGDMWFSEGLASYYQNILQFRMGVISAAEAKQKLLAGFKRGIDDNPAAHLTLSELSDDMSRYRAYMRVYWSGAWYFWQADQALRQQGQSLDLALQYLNNCCSQQQLSVKEIVQILDQYSHTPLFAPLYTQTSNSYSLTIESSTWKQLQPMTWPQPLSSPSDFLH